MIQIEYLNDGTLVKHYSDANKMLLQVETGAKYAEPIDIVPCPYTYEELDEFVDGDEEITGDEFIAEVEAILGGADDEQFN